MINQHLCAICSKEAQHKVEESSFSGNMMPRARVAYLCDSHFKQVMGLKCDGCTAEINTTDIRQ